MTADSEGSSTSAGNSTSTGGASVTLTGETGNPTEGSSTGEVSTSPTSEVSTSPTSEVSTSSTGEVSTSSTGEPLPDMAVLQLAFSQVKQFDFSWAVADGAVYYRLLERPTADGDYEQIGEDIVGESISRTMPLHLRFGASYILQACNNGGCTDSEPVDVVNSLAAAVGYFKASVPGTEDQFGHSVAISADGDTLAVGAHREGSAATGIGGDQNDNSAPEAGAVYVFVRMNAVWKQQAYLKASNAAGGDRFGTSLAMSDDGNTLAVGAIFEDSAATGVGGNQADNSAQFAGAAYVFVRSNADWSQQAYLKASNTGGGDYFGTNMSMSADGNTLAVSAFYEDSASGNPADNAAMEAGAAYVFLRSNKIWVQQAYIKASNPGSADYFGYGLALSDNGDTLAVGAHGEASAAIGINGNQADASAANAGAVYVYTQSNGLWSQEAYLKASNTDAGDLFGYSVALSQDGTTLAVGAYGEASAATGVGGTQADNSLKETGAVYMFVRSNNVWAQQAYLKASNTGAVDRFGGNVALSKDGNLLAVAANYEDSAATGIGGDQADNSVMEAGAIYVFERKVIDWSQRAYVKAASSGVGDYFGFSLAMSADGSTIAAGALFEDSAAAGLGGQQADNSLANAGALYLF